MKNNSAEDSHEVKPQGGVTELTTPTCSIPRLEPELLRIRPATASFVEGRQTISQQDAKILQRLEALLDKMKHTCDPSVEI